MNKINLTKYGFSRCAEEDFSDDGTRFQVYRLGKYIRVSKASYKDQIYLSARLDYTQNGLTYNEYSKLPHFNELDKLNGVSKSVVTEEDLKKLYDDCVAVEKEYDEKLANISFPEEAELINALEQIKQVKHHEFEVIADMLSHNSSKLLDLKDWEFRMLKKNYKDLIEAENKCNNKSSADKAREMHNTFDSRRFIEDLKYYLAPSWAYQECLKLLEKVGIE